MIRVLTGIEVPHGERSTDYGVQCFNVGTAYAIYEAIALGQPLISRIVTVAGNVGQARNYEVLFGTPMRDLMALCRPLPDSDHVIMGGPMMGFRMPGDEVPVVKATNGVPVSWFGHPVPAAATRNVLHPLRRMCQGLSVRPATL